MQNWWFKIRNHVDRIVQFHEFEIKSTNSKEATLLRQKTEKESCLTTILVKKANNYI